MTGFNAHARFLARSGFGAIVTATLFGCGVPESPNAANDDPADPVALVLSSEAPACDDPGVYDVLRELWIDEHGVAQTMQITQISDSVEFRYDRVRDKRYCNVSIFFNGYDVEFTGSGGQPERRRYNEARVGFSVTNVPETNQFEVQVNRGWEPHTDNSFSSAVVALALAQRPEICEQMLRDYAANPANAPYLWVLEEPGIDCWHGAPR